MAAIIFYAIIIILVLDFVLESSLSYLNIKNSSKQLPPEIANIYDNEKYEKQQSYMRTNAKFGWATSTFSLILIILLYTCGGFAYIDEAIRTITSNELLVSLLFFATLYFANDILTLPFQVYATFIIEGRYGFNKISPKLFILDKIKNLGIALIIGGGLLALIIYIYQQIPDYFWIVAWSTITAFGLFMSLFYSELIVPLFNKQTPLPEGDLRNAIEKFAQKTNFELHNIYVIDGSKRSTKANAYFTGWGGKKRIVLYDTLINQLTIEETVAVLAHEIGHNKHKHTLKSLLISLPSSLLMFVLLGLMLKSDPIAQSVGVGCASFHINMLVFSILYTPISLVIDLLGNILSRKYEYQADSFVRNHGEGEALISSLKKISSNALSNLMPHPAFVFFNHSHPTLLQRIRNINKKV